MKINKANRVLLGEETTLTAKYEQSVVERDRWAVAVFTAEDSELFTMDRFPSSSR